ncbi:HSP20-like chaperone [Fennellomyces sp. T-0311]|nr:HSP20-like chaperone [Fennellomyces sp. T-0311]
MSMINWNAWSPFGIDRSVERRVNQIFNHMYQDFPGLSKQLGDGTLSPAVSIYETDTNWVIHAEIPGVKKEDIKLDVTKDFITITAESKFDEQYTKDNVRYQERHEGTFSRKLSLPDHIDREKIGAKFENGVLEVTMPKVTDPAKHNRKITIE